jgi:hypothetical protein
VGFDDGGINFADGLASNIAFVEAKGDLQRSEYGVPKLTDEILAQVVGEAVGLKFARSESVFGDE